MKYLLAFLCLTILANADDHPSRPGADNREARQRLLAEKDPTRDPTDPNSPWLVPSVQSAPHLSRAAPTTDVPPLLRQPIHTAPVITPPTCHNLVEPLPAPRTTEELPRRSIRVATLEQEERPMATSSTHYATARPQHQAQQQQQQQHHVHVHQQFRASAGPSPAHVHPTNPQYGYSPVIPEQAFIPAQPAGHVPIHRQSGYSTIQQTRYSAIPQQVQHVDPPLRYTTTQPMRIARWIRYITQVPAVRQLVRTISRVDLEPEKQCMICLDHIVGTATEIRYQRFETKCKHHFHRGCIQDWLRGHRTCPICRKNVQDDRNRLDLDSDLEHDEEAQDDPVEHDTIVAWQLHNEQEQDEMDQIAARMRQQALEPLRQHQIATLEQERQEQRAEWHSRREERRALQAEQRERRRRIEAERPFGNILLQELERKGFGVYGGCRCVLDCICCPIAFAVFFWCCYFLFEHAGDNWAVGYDVLAVAGLLFTICTVGAVSHATIKAICRFCCRGRR